MPCILLIYLHAFAHAYMLIKGRCCSFTFIHYILKRGKILKRLEKVDNLKKIVDRNFKGYGVTN